MAIVIDKSQRWRVLAAHIALILLCAAVLFPLLMVISISLRPGNFATGSLIPETISLEHWRFALGLPSVAVLQPFLPESQRWLLPLVVLGLLLGTLAFKSRSRS